MSAEREPRRRDGDGALRFARYAYPPNALGYCGPADAAELFGAVESGNVAAVSRLAGEFAGAWPYLQLIAGSNALHDPLDPRVTEAYWLGNHLLDQVAPRLLAASLEERFGRQVGLDLPFLVEAALRGGVADHSFHVFAVSPWVGMLRAGKDEQPALTVLDRCRIRWGTVESVEHGAVTVRVRPLLFVGSHLVLGEEHLEVARYHAASASAERLPEVLTPGERVSLHWDWVCERLDPQRLAWLRGCTLRNLSVVNAARVPGPAVAAETWGG